MFGMSKRDLAALVSGLILVVASAAIQAQDAAEPDKDANVTTPAAGAPAAPDANVPATDTEAAQIEGKKAAELWKDLLHYIKLARTDLAVSYGQALLDSGVTPREMYILSTRDPQSLTLLRTKGAAKDLKPVVAKIQALVEEGYRSERAAPKQIEEAIDMLSGSLKAFELAAQRLQDTGELALPQLIGRLMSPKTDESLRNKIIAILPRFGQGGVRPLSEVLQSDNPFLQEQVSLVLGQVPYKHSAPMLKALLAKPNLGKGTQAAVRSALLATVGAEGEKTSLAEMYYNLAEKYYRNDESVQADPRFESANIWYWKEDLGLTYKSVPRAIFCDVYAMRYARLALQADPTMSKAVALWLAANFKKESLLPEGAKDASRDETQPPAKFYALASSATYLQDVLARGLDDRNSAVIIGAIEALARTAGTTSLTGKVGGKQPLVEALSYPDSRVRFLAAITLASALPQDKFLGCDSVMPILNDALRLSNSKRAVLLTDEKELGNKIKGLARDSGWEVVDADDAAKAIAAAQQGGAFEMVILAGDKDAAAHIDALRKEINFASVPALVITAEPAMLKKVAENDKFVKILGANSKEETITKALSGSGADVTPEVAQKQAVAAANAVRVLSTSGNKVFDVATTVSALSNLLKSPQVEARLAAAAALAVLTEPSAQQALVNLALTDADEKVKVAAFGLATESVRRFGNKIADAQAASVLEVVTGKGSTELREAAAQLSGSLNLPSQKIKDLILQAE